MSDAGERNDSTAGLQPLDDETLAAFVDGVLEGEERERVLEAIDRDPDTYRVFLETSAYVEQLAGEAEGDGGRGDADPPNDDSAGGRRGTAHRSAALTLAAAVLLLVVTLPIGTSPPDASQLASRIEVGEGANLVELLRPTRGFGFQSSSTPTERSLRLGALVVDLEVARRLGDVPSVRRAGSQLRELTAAMQMEDADRRLLELAERGETPPPDALAVLESRLRVRSDRKAFDAGRVFEAVRLAQALGDRDYAEDDAVRRALRRAEGFGFEPESVSSR